MYANYEVWERVKLKLIHEKLLKEESNRNIHEIIKKILFDIDEVIN